MVEDIKLGWYLPQSSTKVRRDGVPPDTGKGMCLDLEAEEMREALTGQTSAQVPCKGQAQWRQENPEKPWAT